MSCMLQGQTYQTPPTGGTDSQGQAGEGESLVNGEVSVGEVVLNGHRERYKLQIGSLGY
jgi:hypothetical protein